MPYTIDDVTRILAASGVPMEPWQEHMLRDYVNILLFHNESLNLISRKDEEDVWRNHILHSLAGLALIEIPEKGHILDVGTGGGLPGIPLAIMRPETEFILCDSIAKKIRAVESMVDTLHLRNIRCVTSRAEDLHKVHGVPDQYEMVLTRAVSSLKSILEWTSPLAHEGAHLAAWKGGDLEEEILEARNRFPRCAFTLHPIELKDEDYFLREQKCIVSVQYC